MEVLERLAEAPEGASVTDLARLMKCGKGTVSKTLATLEARQYARQDDGTGRFRLTWRLLALAYAHGDRAGVPRLFMPVLQELADDTDELVQLALVDGDQIRFVAKAEGMGQRVRMLPLVGVWAPVHATASGKAWLASLDDTRLAEVVRTHGLPAVAPRTITTLAALRRDLAKARRLGYAIADGELAEGGRAVAAPIRAGGAVVGAVALSGPVFRLPLHRLHALAVNVRQTAERLSAIWPAHLTVKDFER
jgi:IclR family transcriptional regulator, acetate operon repressor